MSEKKNPVKAAAEKVVEKVQDAVAPGNDIPGAPGPVPPPVDEPTSPTEPLPPKHDQRGPDTYSPTGQETGTPQQDVAQRGAYLTTAQGARLYDTDHSLKAGARGPVLLQDHHLREKITHFDH
ncbi:catalase, partial [Streptomyces californicus]